MTTIDATPHGDEHRAQLSARAFSVDPDVADTMRTPAEHDGHTMFAQGLAPDEAPGRNHRGVVGIDDRYVFSRALGEGGMGEVVLCKDLRIGREVAVKVVHSARAEFPERRARFLREACIQGQLEHPAIVPVYDLQPAGNDGEPFFTMQHVRGETLEDIVTRLRQGDRATTREYTRHKLLSAFARACLAVDFAHAHGVLHRDLKPSNMMFGRFGEVYLLDWGIAKHVESDDPWGANPMESRVGIDPGSFTAPGIAVGTPAYMAPEQMEGRTDLVGPHSDVYSLGAILFELLTLQTLHGAESRHGMVRRVLQGVEARPSIRAPEQDVPPELEAVCVRATARKLEDRYASARELADAVEAHLAGDRDVELRRELAARHLARAHDASTRAALDDATEADRTLALQEAGRAIALAPDDEAACRLVVELLTEPPKSPPREIIEEVEQTRIAALRTARRWGAVVFAGFGVVVGPLALLLGMCAPSSALAFSVSCLATSGLAYYGSVAMRRGEKFRAFAVAAAVTTAASSLVFGVVALLPLIAAVSTMAQMLTTKPSNRRFVVTMNVLAIVVPVGLTLGGFHHHRSDSLLGGAGWPPAAIAIVTVVGLVVLLLGARFAARSRDELSAAETTIALQTWQLRRLVPTPPTATPRRRNVEADESCVWKG